MNTVPPMLLTNIRGGGAVGAVKPVSPMRRSTECATPAVLFVIDVTEEETKDPIAAPGELESPPWTIRSMRGSDTVPSQGVPEGALQRVAKASASILYCTNRRA